ncbi:unnamed protein product [Symbiodinium sp. CCMP2592]|nr:unnamed protein product [Symbiodinium sp. CCMP2592]
MPVPFDFLQSREFFVADDCSNPSLMPKLRSIPKSLEGRRALLEQRLKVKMLKEGVHAALRQDMSYFTKALGSKGEAEYLPAVELHMFPLDPMNATAEWQALLVPTVPEVFGQKLHLCHKSESQEVRCIAELPFPPLPRHLQAWMGAFDPLKRLRSMPIWTIRLAEGSLLLGLALLLAAGVYLMRIWCGQPPEKHTFNIPELPTKFFLARHTELHPDAGGKEASICILDSGREVVVEKIAPATRYIPIISLVQEWEELFRRAIRGPSNAFWGRIKEPAGWILLHEDNGETRVLVNPSVEACLKAHPDLVPPLVDLIKKNLVLFGAYVSAQWVALARLTAVYQPESFACLVCGMCVVHLVVLLQQTFSLQRGLEHEERLQQKQLLRLSPQHLLSGVFGAVLTLMTALLVSGVSAAWSETSRLSGIILNGICLALHGKHLHDAIASHKKWREPQVQSKEYLALTMFPLQATEDAPPELTRERAQNWLVAKAVKATFSWLAASVLAVILLDAVQLRGQLLKYDVSRGYLTSPGCREAFHNTLLLDTNADSLTLNAEVFDAQSGLMLKVEHPLLNSSEEIGFNSSGEHQISLPSGPLYGRIVLRALGSYKNTNYTIHVIRVASAVTVSMNSSFNGSKYPKLANTRFLEKRRLQYLLQHPTWYVPDLDMVSNSTIEVVLDSVVLAPLVPAALGPNEKNASMPMVSSSQCSDICGAARAGFGNDCIYEEAVDLPEPLCVGQNTAQDLNLEKSDLSVAGKGSALLDWLRDVNVSGKMVTLDNFEKEGGSTHLPFKALAGGLYDSFLLSTPLASLAGGVQLDIAVTQDPTNAEDLTIPLVIVPHPPPIQLDLNGSKIGYFLLPEMMRETPRTEYAICGNVDAVQNLSAKVDDPRFTVLQNESHEAVQCTGHGFDSRTEFRVVRAEPCDWCEHYTPWDAAGYDLVLRRSILLCLETAVNLENAQALESILKPTIHAGDAHNKCLDKAGLLGDAIRKTKDAQMVQVMLKMGADASALSRGQTPLQIAAARGNLDAMKKLFNTTASKEGSLGAAASQCQVEAMDLIISQGTSDAQKCEDSPTYEAFMKQPWFSCRERPNLLKTVFDLLQQGTTYKMDPDCKGEMLNRAIHHRDADVARLLLQEGADANRDCSGTPLEQLMAERKSGESPISIADFKKIAQLLMDYKLDIDDLRELVIEAAYECDLDLVKALLQLSAGSSVDINEDAINAANGQCSEEAKSFVKVLSEAGKSKQ